MEGWLALSLTGRDEPVIVECISAHKAPQISEPSSESYEFITRLPLTQEPLPLPTDQPMEFLFESGCLQLRGYLLFSAMSEDGSRLRFQTTGAVAAGF